MRCVSVKARVGSFDHVTLVKQGEMAGTRFERDKETDFKANKTICVYPVPSSEESSAGSSYINSRLFSVLYDNRIIHVSDLIRSAPERNTALE